MRECPRCKITFHLEDRTRCLYCDTLLRTVGKDSTSLEKPINSSIMSAEDALPVVRQLVEEHGIEKNTRHQFIIGCYFQTRTLHFMYSFNRHEFLTSPNFKRELIEPFHATSLLMLPWFVFNILDSFFCRIWYTKYCAKCGQKCHNLESNNEHKHADCEYNREYKEVVDSILEGTILKEEKKFKQLGLMKKSAGRRSAYWDLCQGSNFLSGIIDIMSIWFSICLWIILVVALAFPVVIRFIYSLEL